jgi:8-oxo-dGTP diphosphatase
MRSFACDSILIENGKLLLIKRAYDPFAGQWALPGGRIDDGESAEDCLVREMKEETNLEVEPVRFTGLYSDPNRDPRGVIAAAYLVKRISGDPKAGDDAAEVAWFELNNLPPLCADHKKIVEDALIEQK